MDAEVTEEDDEEEAIDDDEFVLGALFRGRNMRVTSSALIGSCPSLSSPELHRGRD